MINETLILGVIISTVLGLVIFYVSWRYLLVVPYFFSEPDITTEGTITGEIDLNSLSFPNITTVGLESTNNMFTNMEFSSTVGITDYNKHDISTVFSGEPKRYVIWDL